MAKFVMILAILAVGAGVWCTFKCNKPQKIPYLDPEEWWGPEELKGKEDQTLKPFKIKFDDVMVADLRQRLKNPRPFMPPLEDVAFEYGFNTKNMKSWLSHWADKYDFKERENFFNQYAQFTTYIQGLKIHFLRIKLQKVPEGVQILPLLLIHGWPGSVREFYEAIPLLIRQTPGYDFVFELIIPSLPGYGYSDAPSRPGVGPTQIAVIFKNLMQRLGFQKFYVQGGDWGSAIGSSIATLYPEDVLGFHTNFPIVNSRWVNLMYVFGNIFPSFVVESHLADRMYPISAFFAYTLEEFGYAHIHATKPDTVGVALSDSPAGLLAYILEKFSTWTNRDNKQKVDGGLEERYTKDQLIDNLMMYWAPNKITSSMRLYAENFSSSNRNLEMDEITSPVPTWVFQAKHEVSYRSPRMLRTKYTNLLGVTVSEDGGHFLALELPKVLVEDVFKAVKAFREFHEKKLKSEL